MQDYQNKDRLLVCMYYVGYLYHRKNLNWAARNLRLGRMRPSSHGLDMPCFPDNKTGLILILIPKFTLGLIFGGCLILIYQKMKLRSKN